MLYSKRRKNLGGHKKCSNRKSFKFGMSGGSGASQVKAKAQEYACYRYVGESSSISLCHTCGLARNTHNSLAVAPVPTEHLSIINAYDALKFRLDDVKDRIYINIRDSTTSNNTALVKEEEAIVSQMDHN